VSSDAAKLSARRAGDDEWSCKNHRKDAKIGSASLRFTDLSDEISSQISVLAKESPAPARILEG
jgi:hypothetical protein